MAAGRGGDRAGPGKHEQREKLPERGAQLVFKSGSGKQEGYVRGSGTQQSAGAEARAGAGAGMTPAATDYNAEQNTEWNLE